MASKNLKDSKNKERDIIKILLTRYSFDEIQEIMYIIANIDKGYYNRTIDGRKEGTTNLCSGEKIVPENEELEGEEPVD